MSTRDEIVEELAELYRQIRMAREDSDDVEAGLRADREAATNLLDAYRAEVLREAADTIEKETGPRTMPHETARMSGLVGMVYATIDRLRRMAEETS